MWLHCFHPIAIWEQCGSSCYGPECCLGKMKAIRDASLTETFLSFAWMCHGLKIEKVADGERLKLRFSGAAFSSNTLRAVQHVLSLLNSNGQGEFHKACTRLDLRWGRDTLSASFTKMHRLAALAKAHGTDARPAPEIAAWLVDMLNLALRLRKTSPAKCVEAWLHRDNKKGYPGFWPGCLHILQAG